VTGRARLVLRSVAPFLVALPLLWLLQGALPSYYSFVFINIAVNVILAVSLNVVNGFTGQFSIGHAAFMAVGAYTAALVTTGMETFQIAGLPLGASDAVVFFLAIAAGMAMASLAGLTVGTPSLRLRGDYLAIVTLGFGEIVRIFMNNLNAPVNITNGPQGINLIDPVRLGSFSLSQPHTLFGFTFTGIHLTYYLFLLLTLAVIFISMRLENSRIGRAWVAIREDEIAAAATGINTRNLKLLAFAMGATFGGLAGGLFASFQGFISPESFNLMESIMILCMIVLGGMGHIPGVIFGALLLTLLPEALRYTGDLQRNLLGQIYVDPADLRMLLFGVALVMVMLYRPAGLIPSARRRQEFADAKG